MTIFVLKGPGEESLSLPQAGGGTNFLPPQQKLSRQVKNRPSCILLKAKQAIYEHIGTYHCVRIQKVQVPCDVTPAMCQIS